MPPGLFLSCAAFSEVGWRVFSDVCAFNSAVRMLLKIWPSMRSMCTNSPALSMMYSDMVPPFDAAQSRQARAIFLADASEIWLPSKTLPAPLPPTTNSAGRADLGGVVAVKRGTGALAGLGFGRAG